jgi:hypothetical protein
MSDRHARKGGPVSDETGPEPPDARPQEQRDVRALLARLGRPHVSGGTVVERAALLAEGADFDATMAWILAHGGEPEDAVVAAAPQGGLHGSRRDSLARPGRRTPQRYVLPPGALKV